MTFTSQETEFLVSLLRQVNVNAANPQAQQTIAMTQGLLTKLGTSEQDGRVPANRLMTSRQTAEAVKGPRTA